MCAAAKTVEEKVEEESCRREGVAEEESCRREGVAMTAFRFTAAFLVWRRCCINSFSL